MSSTIGRALSASTPWLVAAGMSLMALDWTAEGRPALLVAALALGAGTGVALHWRATRPAAVTAVVLVLSLGYHVLVPEVVVPFAGLVAVFALARHTRPRRSLLGLAALVGVCAVNLAVATLEDTLFTMAVAVCVWALGEASRSRREAIRQATHGAARDEQARIARELHDVIAHSVTVMVVQASAAGDVFDRRPDQARAALGSIEQVGRDTLGELRRLLGGVRSEPAIAPQPGLARIDELLTPLRTAGLDVALVEVGEPVALPAGVDVSAYRIVQEALTNTVRHARASAAEVTVRYEPGAVAIDVLDDGQPAPTRSAPGYGLVGMRERAALLGGTFDAGPTAHGGFRVHARLPLAAPG